jgi:peptidyl-prolyl cis-trans isomerase SurA
MHLGSKITWSVCFVLLWFGLASGEKLDRIIAVVNGDIILYSELQDYVNRVAKKSPEIRLDDPKTKKQIEGEILQQLIRERLTDQEAKRLKITVSKSEVDQALEGIKRENNLNDAQFDEMLRQGGQNLAQFRDNIKREMERSRLLERVLKSKIVVTDEQVDQFLKSKGSDASPPAREKRRLAMIFLPFPQGGDSKKSEEIEKLGREIYNKLKSGGDFAKLAREHSQGPSASEGGDIGFVATEDLSPFIEEATRGLGKDELSKPVKTPQGIYIFRVLDSQKERVLPGQSAGSREAAQRMLYQKELSRKFDEWAKELEAKAFIEISL